MVHITRLLTSFCLLFLTITSYGQVSFDSKEDLEKAANDFFEQGKYSNAKPLFSQLLSKDAMDANYNYRFGVCILFTEADPLKPLPYIEGGANSAGVNKEAHYYLGKAYQFNYRFEDAVSAYQKAKSAGFSKANIDLDRSVQECLNGKVLYNSAIDFKPAQNKEVMASEFYRPYDFRKLKGKVIPMPPTFKTKYDEKNLVGTVVYTPSNSNVLVYASYGEDGVNGKDLYRVNRLPTGEWALPQRLPGTINTKYDEDYAFYDKDSQTLFFASKGHNTMGGYDVFSSVYDTDANSWSTPANLQYPINSPFDDFLYVGDPNGKMAFFTTGRNTAEGKLRVFKTLLHDPEQVELSIVEGAFTDLTDSVYNYVSVTVLDPISNQVVGKYRSHKETGKYLLILPPQNDYTLDVGPREADGFKFELDVPTHDPNKALNQSITYNAESDKGTVTLTNYFDATGKPDSVALAESRPLLEVEDKMVAMPDPAIILAARNQARLDAEAEEAAAVAEVLAAETKAKAEKEAAEAAALAKEEAAVLAKIAQAEKAAEEKAKEELIASNAELQAENEAMKDEVAMIDKQVDVIVELAETQENVSQEDVDAVLAKEAEELAQQAEAKKIAEETRIAKEKAKKDSLKAAELAEKLALEEAIEKENTLVKLQEEQAKLLAAKEAERQDSIANSEANQLAEAKRQQAAQDSILAEKQALAVAENERIEQINREVELAKEKALRDSAKHVVAEQNEVTLADEEAFEDILKEMEEKEAELLLEQALAAETVNSEQPKETIEPSVKPAQNQKEIVSTDEVESSTVNPEVKKEIVAEGGADDETLSESDLFLQTIAKLEAQKAEQEKLIEEENKELADSKMEQAALQIEEKESRTDVNEGLPVSEVTDGVQSKVSAEELLAEGEEVVDVETEIVALKSDANPEDYLAALNEIEAQIAEEAETRPDKDYTLKPLGENQKKSADGEQRDPVLQKAIDSDRLALQQHQIMAVEKEKALRDEMQKEKSLLDNYDQSLSEELAAIENEVNLLEKELEAPIVDIEPALAETIQLSEPEVIIEKSSEDEEMLESIDEELAAIESMETEVEAEIEKREAKSEIIIENVADTEEVNETIEGGFVDAQTVAVEAVEEMEEIASQTSEIPVTEEAVEMLEAESIVSEEPIAPVISEAEEKGPEENLEEIIAEAEEEWTEPVVEQPMVEENVVSAAKPIERIVTVGTIPFLTAAVRNPDKSKPSFSGIEDKSLRRMVKRMRAEDVGRLAVIKNIKNEKIDAEGDVKAIKDIEGNLRNQDVLANASANSREEYIRPAFDKSHLKERQNVYYKLEFAIKTLNVSETILETMTPEMEMTFAMPEFKLKSEFYRTFADVNSGYREYSGRGFTDVKIIPYLKGEPTTLSTVQGIPFVD